MLESTVDIAPGPDWCPDEVIRLREWGSDRSYALPVAGTPCSIGRSPDCTLVLEQPPGTAAADHAAVSRHHAELVRAPGAWQLRDSGSKNGIWEDDVQRESIYLVPGLEIGLGPYRLIAESPRTIALHRLLSRVIGWNPDQYATVDHAMRAVRRLALAGAPLVVCGKDAFWLARQLHLGVFDRAPFVGCDPRRSRRRQTEEGHRNEPDLAAAIRDALGGTLCVRMNGLPKGSDWWLTRRPRRLRLVLCTDKVDEVAAAAATPIVIPPVAQRSGDLSRLVDEFAVDARKMLGARYGISDCDRELVLAARPQTLSEIAIATSRLVAIQHYGGTTRAAAQLGITHSCLSKWMKRLQVAAERTEQHTYAFYAESL